MVISLKFQMNNRKNALNVESAKGKTGEKGCIFHRTVEMKQPHTRTEPKEKALRGKRIAIPARSPYENGSVLKGRSFPPVYGKIAVPCHKSLGNVLPPPHAGKPGHTDKERVRIEALPPSHGESRLSASMRLLRRYSSSRTRGKRGHRTGRASSSFPPAQGKGATLTSAGTPPICPGCPGTNGTTSESSPENRAFLSCFGRRMIKGATL